MATIRLPGYLDTTDFVLTPGTYTQLTADTLGNLAADADGWPQAFAAANAIADSGHAQLPALDSLADSLSADPSIFDIGTPGGILGRLDGYLPFQQSLLDGINFLSNIGGDLALITIIGDVILQVAEEVGQSVINFILGFFGY